MLKGVYKEFISVKLKNNTLYDEAIFILKRTEEKFNNSNKKSKRTDLLFEANRILCEQGIKKPRKRFKVLKKNTFFRDFITFRRIFGSYNHLFYINLKSICTLTLTFNKKYDIIWKTENKINEPSGKMQGAGLRFNAWQGVLRFFCAQL